MKAVYKTIFKLAISAVLFYFALRNVSLVELWKGLISAPVWLVLLNLFFILISTWLMAYRWALILLKKVTFKQSLLFLKCSYLASFYSLVFPTTLAGDALKWLPLNKIHGHLGKVKIASSVLVDKIVGASTFFPLAFLAVIVGRMLKIDIPEYMFWIFFAFFMGMVFFYLFVFFFNFEKIFGRFKFLNHLLNIFDILKKENKLLILKSFLLSIITQTIWLVPAWFNSRVFGANYSLIHIAVIYPIISLLLLLPISIGGWGARENLSLFLFSSLGYSPDKILLVSFFGGLMATISALLGGLAQLF